MKIFYMQQASMIDSILLNKFGKNELFEKKYDELIDYLMSFGFISLFGFRRAEECFFSVPTSIILSKKWAKENAINFEEKNWEAEILAAQMDFFKPDVVYTGNYSFLNKKMKKYLPKANLYCLWNASPIKKGVDLSYFDVGLSFNQVYLNKLKVLGVENVENNTFYFDTDIKRNLVRNEDKNIDVCFTGRYHSMFKDRNKFLYDVYNKFRKDFNVQYFLLSSKRVKGIIPTYPFKLRKAYNSPVFLEDMFEVFEKSKIILNTHSNMTGSYKGNMRVFEALGSESFMISDDGIYPKHLVPGEDFITYNNTEDMVDKISYYLVNEEERLEIANNGYKKIAKYYNTDIGMKNLENIFERYL